MLFVSHDCKELEEITMSKKILIDKHYKNTAPLSMVELKKVIGNQPFHHTILEDVCRMYGNTLSDLTSEQVCIVNAAISLGAMTAKRAERSKKQTSENTAGFLERLESSVNAWETLSELEMLDLIKELMAITKSDARWGIKEKLLQLARNIYEQNFILSESWEKK